MATTSFVAFCPGFPGQFLVLDGKAYPTTFTKTSYCSASLNCAAEKGQLALHLQRAGKRAKNRLHLAEKLANLAFQIPFKLRANEMKDLGVKAGPFPRFLNGPLEIATSRSSRASRASLLHHSILKISFVANIGVAAVASFRERVSQSGFYFYSNPRTQSVNSSIKVQLWPAEIPRTNRWNANKEKKRKQSMAAIIGAIAISPA